MRRIKRSRHKKAIKPINSKKDFNQAIKNNWRYIILFIIFSVGLALGAYIARKGSLGTIFKVDSLFENYAGARINQTVLESLLNAFLPSTIMLIVVYLCGLSAPGGILIFLMPGFRGLGLGLMAGYMYGAYALKGMIYCVATVFPQTAINIIILIVGCVEGLRMSVSVASVFRRSSGQPRLRESMKLYTTRFITLIALTGLASLLETLLITLFAGMLEF